MFFRLKVLGVDNFLTNFAVLYGALPPRAPMNVMGKFTQFKVQLASLPDGHHEQDFVIDTDFFKNMENPDILSADVHVHMDLDKRGDTYDCRFHCQGTLQIPCDRCLDPLTHEIDTTYHVVVKYGDEFDDGADDLLVIPWSNTSLNVAYMLNDTLLLTIPLRHVHPAGQCNRAMAAALSRHSGSTADTEAAEAMDDADRYADEPDSADPDR